MATAVVESFDVWLVEKLTSVSSDIDTDVFVSYIIGILEEDNSEEEKTESISELLEGVDAEVAATACKSVLEEWKASCDRKKANQVTEDIGEKLSKMMGKQTLATVKEKTLSKEEHERKEAILAHYAQVSDGEESNDEFDDEDVKKTAPSSKKQPPADPLLTRNANKEDVHRLEREAREKAKLESERKKEKDKQDRQAQKQKDEERKESEKNRTQKGERRR